MGTLGSLPARRCPWGPRGPYPCPGPDCQLESTPQGQKEGWGRGFQGDWEGGGSDMGAAPGSQMQVGQLQPGWRCGSHTGRCQNVSCGQSTRQTGASSSSTPVQARPPHHIHTGYCSLLSALHPSTSPCPQSPPTAPMASCIFTLPSASLLPAPLLKVLLGDLSDPMKGQASPSSFPSLLLVTALHCPTRHTLFARCLPQRRQTPCHPRAPSNQSIWQGPSQ